MYDYYEYGENDLEVDMYVEEHQLEKEDRRQRNSNAHWRETIE